jgi:O-antigen ligase
MNALARAGWLLCAAFFAVLTASLFHVDFVGRDAYLLMAAVALGGLVRPVLGLSLVALVVPVVGVVAGRWNGQVQWPEVLVCAALVGLSLEAAWHPRQPGRTAASLAVVFGVLVACSILATTGVVAIRLGPAFTEALTRHLTREHFIDVRGFPAITAGLRLLEGILLFGLAARASLTGERLRWFVSAVVGGATIAASMNVARLLQAAARRDAFWSSLIDLSQRLRWNVHYGDFNAAGSYFVMALLFAVGLVLSTRRLQRFFWTVCSVLVALALWLTSSRTAFLAGAVAAAVPALLPHIATGRVRLVRAAAIAVVGLALLAGLAVALPWREGQVSPVVAADVRFGMWRTGARMVTTYPAFGVGVGQFTDRAGEFTDPKLIEKLPGAAHENAHNNFLQIAAELGLTGIVAFTWLVAGGLIGIARGAAAEGGRATDPTIRWALAGLIGFLVSCLAGHPLLVPESAFGFWIAFGALAGTAPRQESTASRQNWWIGGICLALLIALPWRLQGMLRDANLEHVGIGVSSMFQTAPDGTRYREAKGSATLFVPVGAFKVSVNPQTAAPVRLELKLDGRVADVVSLAPGTWNDISIPARTERASARYARLDLRVLDADEPAIWITKVQPLH